MEKRALLVYPEFPSSYWSFRYALDFVNRKSVMPPLGLLTIAAMFPDGWEIKLVDMNVESLTDEDLAWATHVFTSTMVVQQESFCQVVRRSAQFGLPVIAGGPHPTSYQEEIERAVPGLVSVFFSGEAEEVLGELLSDLEAGKARQVYAGPRLGNKYLTDVSRSPRPRFDLLKLERYRSMAVQFTRGCPYDCEFCDITKLYGRVPRIKTSAQITAELECLYELGWRRSVMFVDDNFIGNKKEAMELLLELGRWQKEHGYPFDFYTEATIELAWQPRMLPAMNEAGFSMVFVGIESPNDEALTTTKKPQNLRRGESARDFLLRSIREIQRGGLEVSAGFIVGLDGDREFDSHIDFIQEAGIPMAMAGLLVAIKGTNLWNRLKREGRLLGLEHSGSNTDFELNFKPQLPRQLLFEEYQRVVSTLYSPTLSAYFKRSLTLIENLGPTRGGGVMKSGRAEEIKALFKSLWRQGLSRQGPSYLAFLAKVLWQRPEAFPLAVSLAINGYHFQKMTDQTIAVWKFGQYLEHLKAELAALGSGNYRKLRRLVANIRGQAAKRLRRIHPDFRARLATSLNEFLAALAGIGEIAPGE